ncbi:uncharacterized protein [Mytilus edulis]|uniref:uncharacterized protein n=1 Tax=Mytilus edulis TaxID=6550 RepID=UPI0039F05FCD
MVVMYTALVLLICTTVLMKDIKNTDITTSADVHKTKNSDLKGRSNKDHNYNFEEIGLSDNRTDLLPKNCSNSTTNYNCKLAFMNCSIHCIKCVSQGVCKGCEVGFYGQTCHLKCLLNCGADGCNQHTGKCDGSGGNDDIDVDIKVYVGGGVGGVVALFAIGLLVYCKKKHGHDYHLLESMNNECCNKGKCCC